ncbi:hypothetical protein Cpir12675_003431 [Ceratocystis pirilliformis]|uniref:CWF21 domain-containing protein n=1 Tax=Ceratocystis pirilliformis TaxID=259994 RepID=A0ABR3Z413_9PEZI
MDNVGLSTPRGSGTSGYVQRNLAHIKPRNYPAHNPDAEIKEHRPREANQDILEHDRKRAVESKVFDLRDKLEDEGVDEDEIDQRCDNLRKQLLAKLNNSRAPGPRGGRRDFKAHEVHEMADAKQRESERMRRALRLGRGNTNNNHSSGGPSGGPGSSLNPDGPRDGPGRRDRDGHDERDRDHLSGSGRNERRYRDRDDPKHTHGYRKRGSSGDRYRRGDSDKPPTRDASPGRGRRRSRSPSDRGGPRSPAGSSSFSRSRSTSRSRSP